MDNAFNDEIKKYTETKKIHQLWKEGEPTIDDEIREIDVLKPAAEKTED